MDVRHQIEFKYCIFFTSCDSLKDSQLAYVMLLTLLIILNQHGHTSINSFADTRRLFWEVIWILISINMRKLKSWWLMIWKTGCVIFILRSSNCPGRECYNSSNLLLFFNTVQRGSNLTFLFCGQDPLVWPLKWKLLSSTYLWRVKLYCARCF